MTHRVPGTLWNKAGMSRSFMNMQSIVRMRGIRKDGSDNAHLSYDLLGHY